MHPSHFVLLLCLVLPLSRTLHAQWDRQGSILSGGSVRDSGLVIERFYPMSGTVGQEIVITGRGFVQTGNQVFFGANVSVISYEVSAGGTELRVIVPDHARSGRIRVMVGAQSAFSGSYFTLDPLTMVGFSPDTVAYGDPLTIVGTGFSVLPRDNRIRFYGYAGNVYPHKVDREGTQMTLFVPKGAETGKVSINSRSETIHSYKNLIVRQEKRK